MGLPQDYCRCDGHFPDGFGGRNGDVWCLLRHQCARHTDPGGDRTPRAMVLCDGHDSPAYISNR